MTAVTVASSNVTTAVTVASSGVMTVVMAMLAVTTVTVPHWW